MFEREYPKVRNLVRRFGVRGEDAEDVTQDIFVTAYRRLPDLDAARPLRPWLFGFAFRAASDYRRLARHRVEVMTESDAPASAPLAEDAIAKAEDAKLLEDALSSIDIDKRAVLVAYEIDEQPMKEIADALGIPVFTAYSRLRTAREELAENVRRLRKSLQRRERGQA